MLSQVPSLFGGLPASEYESLLAGLHRQRFPAGATVLAEGDASHLIYLVEAGIADVWMTDRSGQAHLVDRVGPGLTLGEMSFLTGAPVSATVRAAVNLDLAIIDDAAFARLAVAYPHLHRDLAAIMSARFVRNTRRSLERAEGRVVLLVDEGAPELLGYAVACSVAWHTRRSVLHVVLGHGPPPERLGVVAATQGRGALDPLAGVANEGLTAAAGRVHLHLAEPTGPFAPERLVVTLRDLAVRHDHVLVQTRDGLLGQAVAARTLRLVAADGERRPAGHDPLELVVAGWCDGSVATRPNREGLLCVPPLTAEDEQALAIGALPPATPGGRALGWAARDIAGLKVGLAFGAGSTKGYAHLGVLRALARAGLGIDCVAGASIGSIVAAGCAFGYDPDEIADLIDRVGSAAFRLTVPTRSLLSAAGLERGARSVLQDRRIEDARIPLAMVAVDLLAREEVIFRSGPVWEALMASIAIPGVYPPRRAGSRLLVDGGVLNPVPTDVVAGLGAGVVIAIKLAGRPAKLDPTAKVRSPWLPEIVERTIAVMQGKIVTDTAAAATMVIEPELVDVAGFGLRRFPEGRRFIEAGEAAAEAALPRLAAVLPWLNPNMGDASA